MTRKERVERMVLALVSAHGSDYSADTLIDHADTIVSVIDSRYPYVARELPAPTSIPRAFAACGCVNGCRAPNCDRL